MRARVCISLLSLTLGACVVVQPEKRTTTPPPAPPPGAGEESAAVSAPPPPPATPPSEGEETAAAPTPPPSQPTPAPDAPADTTVPPPPPPPPPLPPPAPEAPANEEVVALLSQTHPELLDSIAGVGKRAAAAARAPARDPVRAERIGRALDGASVLAELTNRLAADATAPNMTSIRDWLATPEGQAFVAARRHAIEVRKARHNLAGPSLAHRNAARRLLVALGDGRFVGRLEHGVTTQSFLGSGAAGKASGDVHKNIIAQGPWLLDRASDLGTSTSQWTIAQVDSVSSFWESPVGREWVDAIDRHLDAIVKERIAGAESGDR